MIARAQIIHGHSPIAELIDMVYRRAPMLMRCGGMVGSRPQEKPPAVTEHQRCEMARLLAKGWSIDEIAEHVGVVKSTVAKHTRELRPVKELTEADRVEAKRKRVAYSRGYQAGSRGYSCDETDADYARGWKTGNAARMNA